MKQAPGLTCDDLIVVIRTGWNLNKQNSAFKCLTGMLMEFRINPKGIK